MSFRGSCALAAVLLAAAPAAARDEGKKVALVVGVNTYRHAALNHPKPLEFAEADAAALAKELKAGGYDEVVVLAGKDATAKGIREKLDALRKQPGSGGVFLVALAGHGLQPEGRDAYFCPYDADQRVVGPKDPNAKDPWDYDTMVPLADVLEYLKASSASTRVLLVDACRNDPKSGRGVGVGTGLKVGDLTDNTAVLLSCSAGQRAFEDKGFGGGHGAFFHHVLEGMRGKGRDKKGRVTADSLWEYVRDAVPEAVAATVKGVEQKPFKVIFGEVDFGVKASVAKAVDPKNPVDASVAKAIELKKPVDPGSAPGRLDSTRQAVTVDDAKKLQEAWAKHLGLELPVRVNVGGSSMEFVLVPPGSFMMGSQRRVNFTKPFLLSAHEVRQAEYNALAGKNPSWFKRTPGVQRVAALVNIANTDAFPVENASWKDAQEFAAKVQPACKLALPQHQIEVRLPTEAEWEYAGRAGGLTPFQNGQRELRDGDANFKGKGLGRTEVCGKSPANPFGLHDMHGNVAEWCQDAWEEKLGNFEVVDPTPILPPANVTTPKYAVRGGSWMDGSPGCDLGHRSENPADRTANTLGFRVAIVLKLDK